MALSLVAQAWDAVASGAGASVPSMFSKPVVAPEWVPTQAAPPPSGAEPAYPLNHTLDPKPEPWAGPTNANFETGDGPVGSPPENHDFEDAPVDVDEVPNGDFETGTWANWATAGTVSLSSDPTHGWWAQLGSSGSITSDPIEVADAQAFTWSVGYLSLNDYSWVNVDVLSGPSFATSTRIKSDYCYSCGYWATQSADATAFANQTVKLKFSQFWGSVGVDDVAVQKVLPHWTPTGAYGRMVEAGGNAYATTDYGGQGKLLSAAFTADSSAQQAQVRIRAESPGAEYRVFVAPGPSFSSFTQLAWTTAPTSWQTASVNIGAYAGQQVKLRVESAWGRVGFDDVGVQVATVPGWTLTGTTSREAEGGGYYVSTDGTLTSAPVTLPANLQNLNLRHRGGSATARFFVDLLRGADFSTVTTLSGLVESAQGVWDTLKLGVSDYAGETVKVRIRQDLGTGHYDDAGTGESLLPGWKVRADAGSVGVATGDDVRGSYAEPHNQTGVVLLRASDVNTGIIDATGTQWRSYAVAYEIGFQPDSMIFVDWVNAANGQTTTLWQTASSTPTGYSVQHVQVPETLGDRGSLVVRLVGGARLYSVGDNVARQQASEPFSRRVGLGVDTTTGNVSIEQQDVAVDGVMPMSFTRFYTGHSDRLGPLGYRWSHTYDTHLEFVVPGDETSDIAVVFGSGREELFDWGATYQPTDPRVHSEFEKNGSTYTLTTTANIQYHFDAAGVLTSIEDDNGNTLVLAYDGAGWLTSVTGPGGRALTLAYDAGGRLASVTDPEGATTTYAYDLAGDLVSATNAAGGVRTYTYDRHRLTEATRETGQVEVAHTFDDFHRVTSQTDAAGETITLAVETPGKGATAVTDPENGVATYYFDTKHRTTDAVDPEGRIIGYRFSGHGNLDKIIDPANEEWVFAYDAGDLISSTDPLGNPVSFDYNPKHLPTTITDARGNVTTIAYDGNGNRTSVTDPLGKVTTYTYDPAGNLLTETNPAGETWTYTYNAAGDQTSKTDPLGNTTTYTYDDAGRLTSETDPLGNTTTYTRDAVGRIITITDPGGAQTHFLYDPAGHLLVAEDPLGGETSWDYDSRGLVEAKTDPAGNTTTYTYDANRRMVSKTEPGGATTTWAYDDAGNLVSETDPLGNTTTYTYGAAGRLTSETDPLDRVTAYGYDDAGRLTSLIRPNGGEETFGYDADGNLTSSVDALDRETTHAYDALSRLTSSTDALDHTTTYGYDHTGRLTSVTDPTDRVTDYGYDAAGRRITVTDPADHTTAYAYDDAGRLTSVTDPTDRVTSYTYDAAGRVLTTTEPGGATTTNGYDAAGRLTAVTRPSGGVTEYGYDPRGLLTSVTDPLDHTTTYAYDARGRRVSETDPLDHTTSYGYDAAGRETTITDALGGTVTMGYDAAGQLTTRTDARGKTTAFTYAPLGGIATETDPLNRTTTYTYDAAGQLTSTTDPRNITVTYSYDSAGRQTGITAPGETISFGYDDAGRRTSMDDATGQTTYGHNPAGGVTEVASPQGTIGYSYDNAGRRASMTLPGDRTVDYGYDAAGRLATVTDWADRQATLGYDADGNRTTIERPNGADTTLTYDTAGRLTGLTHGNPGGTLQDFTYTLDAAGNRTAVTGPGGTETYTLDALNRITGVTYPDATTTTWAYDAAGNRTAETTAAGTTNYTYDDAGQLTTTTDPSGTTNYTYDAAGNLTAAGDDTFTWDWANRLVGADTGDVEATYAYNAEDTRVGATIDGDPKTYLNDAQGGLPVIVDDGPRAYLHADEPLATIPDQGDPKYPLADGLGSIRGITNNTGDLTGTANYAPFGAERATTGDDVGLFGYTGEPTDATDLVNLRARQLDPATGRFLSRDTVQPNAPGTQGYNPYAYVANNPTTWTDPSGHFISEVVSGADPVAKASTAAVLARTAAQAWAAFMACMTFAGCVFVLAAFLAVAYIIACVMYDIICLDDLIPLLDTIIGNGSDALDTIASKGVVGLLASLDDPEDPETSSSQNTKSDDCGNDVALWKAPRAGYGDAQQRRGWIPGVTFPHDEGGSESVFFTLNEGRARAFASTPDYGEGVIKVTVPADFFVRCITPSEFDLDPDVEVPYELLPTLNTFPRVRYR